jgi:hypothetical protein
MYRIRTRNVVYVELEAGRCQQVPFRADDPLVQNSAGCGLAGSHDLTMPS